MESSLPVGFPTETNSLNVAVLIKQMLGLGDTLHAAASASAHSLKRLGKELGTSNANILA